MDNYTAVQQHRMRTARQRKRTAKKDQHRELRRLYKKLEALKEAKSKLPMQPLEQPYQKGWKRQFAVCDDVAATEDGPFYEQLLGKLNMVQYWHDSTFKRRVRGSKKRIYEVKAPALNTFTIHEWKVKRVLTEKERTCFHLDLVPDCLGYGYHLAYVFNDPWRYVLKTTPHIITEVKVVDTDLESEIAEIEHYLEQDGLWWPTMKLVHGWVQYRADFKEKPKERNPFKNKPLHTILDEHYYEETGEPQDKNLLAHSNATKATGAPEPGACCF